jgi:hypothetical protein
VGRGGGGDGGIAGRRIGTECRRARGKADEANPVASIRASTSRHATLANPADDARRVPKKLNPGGPDFGPPGLIRELGRVP